MNPIVPSHLQGVIKGFSFSLSSPRQILQIDAPYEEVTSLLSFPFPFYLLFIYFINDEICPVSAILLTYCYPFLSDDLLLFKLFGKEFGISLLLSGFCPSSLSYSISCSEWVFSLDCLELTLFFPFRIL